MMTLRSHASYIEKALRYLLIVLFISACSQSKNPSEKAPDFTLNDLHGNSVQLAQVNSEGPVLIAFWASWCPSCLNEIPVLNELDKKYASKGLRILGVNVQERKSEIEKFIQNTPIDYTVLLDEKGEAASEFGLTALPVVVMLAKGGEILYYGFTIPDVSRYLRI